MEVKYECKACDHTWYPPEGRTPEECICCQSTRLRRITPTPPSKKKRLNLDLSERTMTEIDTIMTLQDIASKTEVIRKGINLITVLQALGEGRLIFKPNDGPERDLLIIL